MTDPVLDKEIESMQEFLQRWESFFSRIAGFRKGGEIEEGIFKERDSITELYSSLFERLEISHDGGDGVAQLLARVGSPESVRGCTDFQWGRIEEERRLVEVRLRCLLGILRERKRDLASRGLAGVLARRVLTSWPFRIICCTALILLILLVLSAILR